MSSCFVKGCRSGYRSIREENIRLGKRQKCLFKTPKCPELKKKWCHILGIEEDQLKPNHVICEDHFRQKDVIKYDVIRLPDGTKLLYEKGRRRLNPEAVPCTRIKVQSGSKTSSDVNSVKQCETENYYRKQVPDVDVNSQEVISGEIKTENDNLQNQEDIQPPYSFQQLIVDINKNGRSSKWANTINGDTIDFLYWDPFRFKVKMVLRVYADLRTKLFTVDQHLIKTFEEVPKSYKDLLQSLIALEKTVLCVGTGINEKHSEDCSGEVDVLKIDKRKRVWKRCQPCCELRRKELYRQRELKKDVKNRLKLTNRKNSRLKIKVDKLKQEVERAKKMCAGIEEKTLYKTISALPLPIQESVRTCLAAAKVKPTGRRYTMNWINECMLIRTKSRKVYEHLRTHFILPLPCIYTLDKYARKMKETSNCEGNEMHAIMEMDKETDSLILDEMNLTKRLDLDNAEKNDLKTV